MITGAAVVKEEISSMLKMGTADLGIDIVGTAEKDMEEKVGNTINVVMAENIVINEADMMVKVRLLVSNTFILAFLSGTFFFFPNKDWMSFQRGNPLIRYWMTSLQVTVA